MLYFLNKPEVIFSVCHLMLAGSLKWIYQKKKYPLGTAVYKVWLTEGCQTKKKELGLEAKSNPKQDCRCVSNKVVCTVFCGDAVPQGSRKAQRKSPDQQSAGWGPCWLQWWTVQPHRSCSSTGTSHRAAVAQLTEWCHQYGCNWHSVKEIHF